MILNNVCMLVSNTARSKSYLQMMYKTNVLPKYCLVYVDNKEALIENLDDCSVFDTEYFNLEEPILTTIKKANIEFEIIESNDINSDIMLSAIKSREEKYFVYSGYGGQILKEHLFCIGKKYIHVHAGKLPYYRGSTTAYYSYLTERKIGATAIFLSETIDAGDVIIGEEYNVPKLDVNIDYIYEPWVRANVLILALKKIHDGEINAISQDGMKGAETYFIIHPLLKHIALLSMKEK